MFFINLIDFEQSSVDFIKKINDKFLNDNGFKKKVYTHSFGCSQNVSDGEKLNGLFEKMGYELTDLIDNADVILFNTCAVRKTAEDRVYGHIGSLKHLKEIKKDLIIIVCGCMTQRNENISILKDSYPYVNIVFGTGAVHTLPKLLENYILQRKNIYYSEISNDFNDEIPIKRTDFIKANVTILQGCNNFCSYCIVPYVRGREISRSKRSIINEVNTLLDNGYKEIMLLGQNVNSYHDDNCNFSELINEIDKLNYDFRIRFMSSHPKDCSKELMDVISTSKHICRHIHLPVQSGSNKVLKDMNRKYTAERYMELIDYAKEKIPNVSFSSDIIVGFPTETYEDFLQTYELVKNVRFNALFTFIFSRREGTPAAKMLSVSKDEEISKWFRDLLELQTEISAQENEKFLNKNVRVLFDGISKKEGYISGRTDGNIIVEAKGDNNLVGKFKDVNIEETMNWAMNGKII